MHGRLIEFALAYYREPLRYPRLADVHHPLPAGFAAMVPAFGAALAPRHLPATAAALHASPEEVLAAGRFLIRQVLLAPGATPWRMLGFEAEAPAAQVRRHYQLLIRLFHPDRRSNLSELDTEYASRLNSAYHALRGEAPGNDDKEAEEDDPPPAPNIGAELIRYFQPQPLIAPPETLAPRPVRWKRLTRRTLLAAALLLILGVAIFILFSLLRPTTVQLQMAVDRQGPSAPIERHPSYLQGTASPLPPPASLKTPASALPAGQSATAGVDQPPPISRTSPATGPVTDDQPAAPPTVATPAGETERLAALEQRQREIAAELARIEAERLALASQEREQARQREEEAQRLEAQRLASLAAAERHQRQVAEAEARLQAERQALERQKAEQAKRQEEQARLQAEERQAALAETRRKQEEAALAEAKLKADRQALEQLKAEQVKRQEEQARLRAEERQAALAETRRKQEEAALAEAKLKAERQALERLKAEQAQHEQAEAKRREAERLAAQAEADRKQQEIATAQARLKAEFEALKQQQAKQQKPVASVQAPAQAQTPAPAPAIKEQPTVDRVAKPARKDADRLLNRFTQAYAAGDLEAYVSLFAPDVRFAEGTGLAQLRSTYRQFFARTPFRQSEITGLHWQETTDGRLTGRGNIRVKIRQNEAQPWNTFNGTIELELTALSGQWKIMRMEHQVK